MYYHASRGETIKFQLFFKNRNGIEGTNDNRQASIFSFGRDWYSPWRSYVQSVPAEPTNVWVFPGDGSAVKFTLGEPEFRSRAILTQAGSTNTLQFPNGTTWRFAQPFTNGGASRTFVTEMNDENGNGVRFNYAASNGTIRLHQILDVDGRAINLEYAMSGGYSNVVTKVISPHGQTNILRYDSLGRLTNIVDSVGLNSHMSYDATNLIALGTPYGTTTFNYFDDGERMSAVKITEMGLRNYLYLYRSEVEGGKVPSDYLSYAPSTTNGSLFAVSNTLDVTNSHQRNSFVWGPRQYESISDLVRTNLTAGTFLVSNLTSADYLKGRIAHWLKSGTNLGTTRSFKREASPDGTTQGLLHWFDYAGKVGGAKDQEGDSARPQLTALKLPNGEAKFTYTQRNSLGHPTLTAETYTSPMGYCQLRTNQFEYASNKIDLIRQVQLVDSGTKQVASNVFNSAHRVLASYNALGEVTTHTYNDKQQRTSIRLPSGLLKTNIYESSGTWSNFLGKYIKGTTGYTNSLTYSNGNIFTRTDERGLTKAYVRDGLGRKTAVHYPDGTSKKRRFENLHAVETVDRANLTNRYAFNSFRQKTQKIDARGSTNSYSYCSCGVLESQTDAVGSVTQFVYDQVGRRCAVLNPGGYAVTNHYDSVGRVTRVSDSFGVSTTNHHNNQGLAYEVRGATGMKSYTLFDMEDHPVQMVDANSITNGFAYDDLGRRTFITNGLGTIACFRYSSMGLLAQTNQMTNYVCYGYDEMGRKIAETNANGEVTQFRYDAQGNLTNLVDAKGNNTWWGYDQYGRVTNKVDAVGNTIFVYGYDANNRLTNRWTPAKGNTIYRYDASGNLTNVDYSSSPDLHFQYDANNRLTRMADGVGTTTYNYSSANNLLSEDGPWSNDTVTYAYTSNRLRSRMSLQQQNASDWVQDYTYDSSARLTSITSPAGTFSYEHDPKHKNLVAVLTLGNGSYITNNYDALGRMLSTVLKNSGGATLNSHAYEYDSGSRRTRHTRSGSDYVDYNYDRVGQLVRASGKEPGGSSRLHEQHGYAYDAAGNLNFQTNNALVQTFTVNTLNQLGNATRSGTLTVAGTTTSSATNVTVNTLTASRYVDNTFAKDGFSLTSGTNTFTAAALDSNGRSDNSSVSVYLPATNLFVYDLNGNLLTDGNRHFSYDDENQLTTVIVTNSTKSEFTYDGKMRRRMRKEYAWTSGSWQQNQEVRYLYDGKLVVEERDKNNSTMLTFTRGTDLSGTREGAGGIGGLLARTENLQSGSRKHACFHADGNGNVTMLTDSLQLVAAKYLYDAFGHTLSASGPLAAANSYRFSSKESHAASGLIYYLYRYSDPQLQRWPNRDPINELGFELLILSQKSFNWDEEKHLYRFLHNNPVNFIDSDGRVPFVAIFFYGNAIGNIAIACYSCKKLNECLDTSAATAMRAAAGLDSEEYQEWLRAAQPGSECTGLMRDCGVRVIQAAFWVAGRLLILRYLATN